MLVVYPNVRFAMAQTSYHQIFRMSYNSVCLDSMPQSTGEELARNTKFSVGLSCGPTYAKQEQTCHLHGQIPIR
jgi:hypothetical protein